MKNLTVRLRNIVAIVSVVLIAIFAFMPLLRFNLTRNERLDWEMDKVVTNAKLMEKLNEGEIEEEKYKAIKDYFEQSEYSAEYTVISFAKAVPNTIKYIRAFIDIQKCEDLEFEYENSFKEETSDEYRKNKYEELEAARAKLRNIDYKAVTIESLNQFRFIFTVVSPSIILGEEASASETISLLISSIIKMIFAFSILVAFPLSMVFAILGLLFAILRKNFGKVMLISRNSFTWAALLLAVAAIWNSSLTNTGTFVVIITIIVIAFNIVASWLTKNGNETKSLLTLQISSLISAVGLYMFITNIIKTELTITWEEVLHISEKNDIDVASFALISVLVCLLMILMPIVYKGIVSVLARAGNVHYGISGKKKSDGVGGAIVFGIIVLAYNFVLKDKYYIELSEEQTTALSMACIGLGVAMVGSFISSATKSRLNRIEE
ncbi:MAG: hypothetical protein J6D23_05295 [Clostridia bacterium]|nr:hypothetical protein [Clostridia bacterium]